MIETIEYPDGTIIQSEKSDNLNEKLKGYANYVGYATDIGNIKDGINTGEPAVTIFVKEKIPLAQLAEEDILPKEINGIQTDVIAIGEVVAPRPIRAQANSLDDYKKNYVEPPCGVSWGNKTITAGTGGGIIVLNGINHLATNTHVACESIRKSLSEQVRDDMQPGPYDGGTIIKGYTSKAIIMPTGQPAFNDFADIQPVNNVKLNPATLDKKVIPRGIVNLQVGDRVWKEGRTTGFTIGTVISLNASVNVGYGSEGNVLHKECIITTDMSDGGDSGSWVYKKVSDGDTITDEDQFVAAYLFAGSSTNTILHNLQNALTAIGATLYTENNEPEPPIENKYLLDIRLKKLNSGNWIVGGTVIDDKTEEKISNAEVTLDEVLKVNTNENGYFEISNIEEGNHSIQVIKENYTPYTDSFTLPPQ